MARVITGYSVSRYLLNMPTVRVEWVDGQEHGHATIVDDDARAMVDAKTGEISFAKFTGYLDALAKAVAEPGTVTARMTAAAEATRQASAAQVDLAKTKADMAALLATTPVPAPAVVAVKS